MGLKHRLTRTSQLLVRMTTSSGVQIWNYLTTLKSQKRFEVQELFWRLHFMYYTEVSTIQKPNNMSFSFSLVWTTNGNCVLSATTSAAAHCLNYKHATSWFLNLAYSIHFSPFGVCWSLVFCLWFVLFWFCVLFLFGFCLRGFFGFCFCLSYLLLQKIRSFSRGFFLLIHECLKNELSLFLLGGMQLHY